MQIPIFNESLRTGLAVIDDQHVGLFELAGRVARMTGTCMPEAPNDPIDAPCVPRMENAVNEAVYGLVDYTTEHFADEQAIMRSAHYPLAGVHASMHADLSRQVAGYVVQLVNGDGVSAEQIVAFFIDWLTNHIMVHDREFVTWLEVHQPA